MPDALPQDPQSDSAGGTNHNLASPYPLGQSQPTPSATPTPSRSLPKSNFHTSSASASARRSGPTAPSPNPAVPLQDVDPPSETTSFQHPEHVIPPRRYLGLEDLVIVCCHAIFLPDVSSPSFPLKGPYLESNWHLAPFQKSDPDTGKPGEHETFLAHISAGLDALTRGSFAEKSILIFSGGATNGPSIPLSEARSYYNAALAQALAQGYYGGGRPSILYDQGRILLEEQATDSYQNLLFSVLLFRRTTGHYPKRVRVITHAFKKKRFLELHASAIRWPLKCIQVQGIDPVMSSVEFEEAVRGEEHFGLAPWEQDPLGTGELLSSKRRTRGWDERIARELGEGLEDGVAELLNGIVPDTLPWEEAATSAENDLETK